jgi:hypothetical protein
MDLESYDLYFKKSKDSKKVSRSLTLCLLNLELMKKICVE